MTWKTKTKKREWGDFFPLRIHILCSPFDSFLKIHFTDFFFPLFTYTGRQFNKYGEISDPWWSNFTLTGFNDKSQCLVDQYSQYPLDIDGLQMFVCIRFFL